MMYANMMMTKLHADLGALGELVEGKRREGRAGYVLTATSNRFKLNNNASR